MRVVIIDETSPSHQPLRQVILGLGLTCHAEDCVTCDGMPVRLAHGNVDLVLVRVGREIRLAQRAIQQASALTSAPVMAVGATKDPQLILRMVRAGARRYLDERYVREELQHVLDQMVPLLGAAEPKGRLLAVTSVVPGVGVSTVAANTAFALANKHPGQVALAELGSSVPSLALTLDLAPRYVLTDVFAQWERLDTTMLRQALCDHPAGVAVLAHPADTLSASPLAAATMRTIGLLLRSMFDHVVADLGHGLDAGTTEAMKLADSVLVVTRLDVPALRLTRKHIQQLMQVGVPAERVHLIANRYGQAAQVARKQAEQAVFLPIQVTIPDDVPAVNRAMNSGMPLLRAARFARITKSFAALAERLARPVNA